MSVETSVVIEFVDGTQGEGDTVIVELDDKHSNNLENEGTDDESIKSSFSPGERPVIIVHHAQHLEITDYKCTAGTISQQSSNLIRERETSALFTTLETENSHGYASASNLSSTWYGNEGIPEISDSNIILSGGVVPCYADFTFNVLFQQQYILIPPTLNLTSDETYTIYVVLYISRIS